MAQFHILVLEDDKNVSSLVCEILEGEGYEAKVVEKISDARSELKRAEYDLLLIDRTLPDGDGLELCAEIRKKPAMASRPILFLTARNSVEEKVEGLRTGGDDYITKPFDSAELLARIEALLRRSGRLGKPEMIEGGGMRLEMESRKAFLKKKPVALWAKEFDLLALLLSQKNRVLSRDFLLQQIWGYTPDSTPSTKVVDVTISHLRQKLEAWGEKIVTVRGYGYRLDP